MMHQWTDEMPAADVGNSRSLQPGYLRQRSKADSLWLRVVARGGGVAVLMTGLLLGLNSGGLLDDAKQRLFGRSAAGVGLLAQHVEVRGLTWQSPRTVLAALGVQPGEPLVGFSPAQAKRMLENLDWVQKAEVLRRYPNGLLITIKERQPVARWLIDGQELLVDREGVSMAAGQHMQRFAHLPQVRGEGANRKAATLVNLLSATPGIGSQLAWAEFVGKRRWNLHMRSGAVVLLPERDAGAALQRLEALQRRHGILQRVAARIDLRYPQRLVLAVSPATAEPADAAP